MSAERLSESERVGCASLGGTGGCATSVLNVGLNWRRALRNASRSGDCGALLTRGLALGLRRSQSSEFHCTPLPANRSLGRTCSADTAGAGGASAGAVCVGSSLGITESGTPSDEARAMARG